MVVRLNDADSSLITLIRHVSDFLSIASLLKGGMHLNEHTYSKKMRKVPINSFYAIRTLSS